MLDQYRFRIGAGVKFELVQRLHVRRIGDGDKQTFTALVQRHGMMLFDQLDVDEIGSARIHVDSADIKQRQAEFLRRSQGHCDGIEELMFNQIIDQ